MGSKMLIGAAHPEETRVVVVNGNRIEEFDYESAHRKQLKGNIYLAKVTRVEPSLQAAFVDYGGNRHGFLAFSEIHPDYYQIPVADREALLREEEEAEEAVSEEIDENGETAKSRSEEENGDEAEEDGDSDNVITVTEDEENGDSVEEVADSADDEIEAEEEPRRQRRKRPRRYRIQEVIKRRQIILVQVVKEERGNKGAALTTYLSLAGRYCVLMPNTARGGGISRKISDAKDRKRLKDVIEALKVPAGAGLIVRTAGASRTKAEIKRDFDYLLRQWGNIRDLTLKSVAPSLVYEEGNLIKRSIRDLYSKEVDEVLVEGDEAYKDAKSFMKMLMPSHARNVKHYTDTRPLFSRFQVEDQLDALFSPKVTLPSGGYLVMNQTEALVSIDINSGKATREHSIEATALKTNLEASEEIARQLRLRDLAGLIVIDFIDMEERRNNRAVERKLKESLKTDRARIQVGRISHFGLLEMSRQRLRQSMLEGTTRPCSHCDGTGLIRSLSSCALSVLRSIEDYLISHKPENLNVRCRSDVACYILNDKRDHLLSVEKSFGVSVFVSPDESLAASECEIASTGGRSLITPPGEDEAVEKPARKSAGRSKDDGDGKTEGRKKRRGRRRGKRSGRDKAAAPEAASENEATATPHDETVEAAEPEAEAPTPPVDANGDESTPEKPKKKRRSRGRKRKEAQGEAASAAPEDETAAVEAPDSTDA
ncbi:MAG TPA: ribonuclease E/G, partial [Rhizobiales bacterium]|nr:ribonuclease E/G [Hyphomicrobiales bacterium]